MPKPIVTGILPLHNHAQWIEEAIDSFANQDYERKRIVVVDDGSTDDGGKVVVGTMRDVQMQSGEPTAFKGEWKHTGVEILLLNYKAARGPSFARNRGMEAFPLESESDLFAFLDSDDLYEQGKVSRSVAEFERYPGMVGVVYSDYDTIRPDGLRLRQYKEPYTRRRLFQECLPNCDSLISAKAMQEVGGFDESLRVCEDYDLWLRLSEKYLLVHVPESLLTIRVGEHSSSTQVKSDTWKACYARVFEKARERASST